MNAGAVHLNIAATVVWVGDSVRCVSSTFCCQRNGSRDEQARRKFRQHVAECRTPSTVLYDELELLQAFAAESEGRDADGGAAGSGVARLPHDSVSRAGAPGDAASALQEWYQAVLARGMREETRSGDASAEAG